MSTRFQPINTATQNLLPPPCNSSLLTHPAAPPAREHKINHLHTNTHTRTHQKPTCSSQRARRLSSPLQKTRMSSSAKTHRPAVETLGKKAGLSPSKLTQSLDTHSLTHPDERHRPVPSRSVPVSSRFRLRGNRQHTLPSTSPRKPNNRALCRSDTDAALAAL